MIGPVADEHQHGIEFPHGNTDALLAAAAAWGDVAEKLAGKAGSLDGAAGSATMLDWMGPASLHYAAYSERLSRSFREGAHACRGAAAATQAFARELERVRPRCETALVAALDAVDAIAAAKRDIAAAQGERDVAHAQQVAAAGRLATARALGPAGEVHAQESERELNRAADRALDAGTALTRAEGRLSQARGELVRARKAARTAVGELEGEAARASAALSAASAAAVAPPRLNGLPVPVTVRPYAAGDPVALGGAPLSRFGLSTTPSDARRRQIEAQRRAGGQVAPWLAPALTAINRASGAGANVRKAAGASAGVLGRTENTAEARDARLRNGPSELERRLRRIEENRWARRAARGLPGVGIAAQYGGSLDEGRSPGDAAVNTAVAEVGSWLGTGAAVMSCAAVPATLGWLAPACAVLVLGGGVGGSEFADAIYDEHNPPPDEDR